MKKANLYKFLYAVSGLLVFGLIVKIVVNVFRYSSAENPAPLWLFLVIDALIYLAAAIIAFFAARICKKKYTS